jgi:hypothetical protein
LTYNYTPVEDETSLELSHFISTNFELQHLLNLKRLVTESYGQKRPLTPTTGVRAGRQKGVLAMVQDRLGLRGKILLGNGEPDSDKWMGLEVREQ